MRSTLLHLDADCFFVGCEVARDPSLRGKCVVVGAERGIVSALSYEAKAHGVKRGMPIAMARSACSRLIVKSGDYELYSKYSERMSSILREFAPSTEVYSIDECFADIGGIVGTADTVASFTFASKVKSALESRLGLTFSLGVASSKVLCKVASKLSKPRIEGQGLSAGPGVTVINDDCRKACLASYDIGDIWGIGPQGANMLRKYKIRTALDFANRPKALIENLHKPLVQIWHELQGAAVFKVETEEKAGQRTMLRTRTFWPSSRNKDYVFSELSLNIEKICFRARRMGVCARDVAFFLKTQKFGYHKVEIRLPTPTASSDILLDIAHTTFSKMFCSGEEYRATGVVLAGLVGTSDRTMPLPHIAGRISAIEQVEVSIDALRLRHGSESVFLGSSLLALRKRREDDGSIARQSRPMRVPSMGTVR